MYPILPNVVRSLVPLIVVVMIGAGAVSGRANPESAEAKQFHFQNTDPGVKYVGSEVCWYCHYEIYQSFRKAAMGQSMLLPSDPKQLAKVPRPVTVYNKKFDRYFEVMRKGSDLFQSEYQLDAHGQEIFRTTHKIEYVVGPGENVIGYITHRLGNYLVETPLSYYTKSGTWELSPGWEHGDYGFSRPVTVGCIACHSGRALPAPEGNGLYQNPPFREMAIGCENCHGPGQLHVAARSKGLLPAGKVDHTIVNPARLPGWLADNICMNCHQAGDARLLQPGKTYFDFRPGTPLNNTLSIFMVPFDRESPPTDPLLQQYVSMILSKCYRATGGRLHCITCHDPHFEPTASQAPAYFRKKCLQCHTEKSCPIPLKARLQKTPPDNCAGCHMPKQDIHHIAHSSLTNHRIVTNASEPFPEKAFNMTTPLLSDLVHLDAIPGKESVPVRPLTLLKAYGAVKDSRPQYVAPYNALLQIAAQTNPGDPYVLAALGRRKAAEGTPKSKAEAIQLLQKAVERGSTSVQDYALLARLLAGAGRTSDAVAILKRGIQINPFVSRLYGMLVVQELTLRRYSEAFDTMKRALRIFPQDSRLRGLVKKMEAMGGQNTN